MVWDMLEFPQRLKAMHHLWNFAWKSQPCLASFPSCSAVPTQEHFPKESLAGTSLSQDEPLSWNFPHPLPSNDHWVPLSLPAKCLWNLSSSFHLHLPQPRPDHLISVGVLQKLPGFQPYYVQIHPPHGSQERSSQNKTLIMSFLCLHLFKDVPLPLRESKSLTGLIRRCSIRTPLSSSLFSSSPSPPGSSLSSLINLFLSPALGMRYSLLPNTPPLLLTQLSSQHLFAEPLM